MKLQKVQLILLLCLSVFATVKADKWINYNTANGQLKGDLVFSMALDSTGNFWFSSVTIGVSKYDGSNWNFYSSSTSNIVTMAMSIVADKNNNMLFGSYGAGVACFDGQKWDSINVSNSSLLSNFIYYLMQDADSATWFCNRLPYPTAGGMGGVSKLSKDSVWTTYTTANSGLPSDAPSCVIQDNLGNIWIGTNAGLARFDGDQSWTVFNTSNSAIPSDSISSLFQDKDGNIWIGTEGKGVCRFGAGAWITITKPFINPQIPTQACYINDIKQDSNGNILFAVGGAGLVMYDGDTTWTSYTNASTLALNDNVYKVIQDPSTKDIWLASQGGVSQFTMFSLSSPVVNFEAKSDSIVSLKVNSYIPWKLLTSCTWITLSKNKGAAGEGFTVTADENTSTTARSGTVLLISEDNANVQVLQINQAAALLVDNSLQVNDALSFSPNPAKDGITVKTSLPTTISIYDLTGNVVLQTQITADAYIPIQHLANQVYIVEMKNTNGLVTRKLIKE